jgi:hypothetical protein
MPFKISKQERAQLDDFAARLTKEHADLAGVLEEQGAIIEAAYERINGAIDTYNGALADAHSFLEDVSSQAQSDYDDKSDRWREGEKGESVREWIDTLDNVVTELEEIEQLTFDTPSVDITDHAELLEQIEDEPSY